MGIKASLKPHTLSLENIEQEAESQVVTFLQPRSTLLKKVLSSLPACRPLLFFPSS